ncbi:MAG: mechanosensitive ion channel protein MscS [Rhodobacterales bacterium]|nr:MAG: mechanosensitive ion channel protein MscS [Rhodobacterales bacterium]PIE12393.1 MAG: mechanosensitive ion channel protein MscS [Rhodobacterales bacterium]
MAILSRILLILTLTCAPLTAFAQEGTITADPTTVVEQAEKDAAIAVTIRDILGELKGYEDVTVAVSEGVVSLRGTILFADKLEELDGLVSRVEGVVAIENEVALSASVTDRLAPVLERLVSRVKQGVAYLPLAAIALLAAFLMVWFGFFLARLRQPWDRLAPNAFIADIYRMVIRLMGMLAGVVVALDILGATALLSTVLGAAGIIGLAIGFAVRDTVENFIASVLLSIRQPFRPNDAVEIGGDEGNVIRLTSRATILLSFDGNHIRIPNSTVFKSRVVNYSRNPERRFGFELGVAYGTDLAAARRLGEETIAALPFVLDKPAVSSWITEPGDSAVGIRFVGWIDQRKTGRLGAKSEAIRLVLDAFDAAGISMPEPTYRVINSTAKPEKKPARKTASAAMETGVHDELEIMRMVDDERATGEGEDLLNAAAAEE